MSTLSAPEDGGGAVMMSKPITSVALATSLITGAERIQSSFVMIPPFA